MTKKEYELMEDYLNILNSKLESCAMTNYILIKEFRDEFRAAVLDKIKIPADKLPKVRKPTAPPTKKHKSKKEYDRKRDKKDQESRVK